MFAYSEAVINRLSRLLLQAQRLSAGLEKGGVDGGARIDHARASADPARDV